MEIEGIELFDCDLLLTTTDKIHPHVVNARQLVQSLEVTFDEGDDCVLIAVQLHTGDWRELIYLGRYLIFKDGAI